VMQLWLKICCQFFGNASPCLIRFRPLPFGHLW
jgi:hypothetical protein